MVDFIMGLLTGMVVGSCISLVIYGLIFADSEADRDLREMHRAFEDKRQ